jgi:formyl-CoA transferase
MRSGFGTGSTISCNERTAMMRGLRDLYVIEIGQVIAAPFAAAVLADLGATVIKVEKPDGGDEVRHHARPFVNGETVTFHALNRGKHSVVLDLQAEAGIAALHELADRADVLIHNLRPGVPEALGIDPDRFCAAHPRLVYCEISGFGQNGPLRGDPAYEPLMQAISGLVSINGDPAGPPSRVPLSITDLGTGMWTVIGLLTALHERETTGRGSVVRTSLFDTAMTMMAQRIEAYVNEGKETPRASMSAGGVAVPFQQFATADADLFVCVASEGLFVKFCAALEHPEWTADPDVATNRARVQNRAQFVPIIAAVLAQRSREYWLDRLRSAGVPCAPVNTVPEVVATEQFAASEMLRGPIAGTPLRLVGLPLSFDGVRPQPAGLAPNLGAGNARVQA